MSSTTAELMFFTWPSLLLLFSCFPLHPDSPPPAIITFCKQWNLGAWEPGNETTQGIHYVYVCMYAVYKYLGTGWVHVCASANIIFFFCEREGCSLVPWHSQWGWVWGRLSSVNSSSHWAAFTWMLKRSLCLQLLHVVVDIVHMQNNVHKET